MICFEVQWFCGMGNYALQNFCTVHGEWEGNTRTQADEFLFCFCFRIEWSEMGEWVKEWESEWDCDRELLQKVKSTQRTDSWFNAINNLLIVSHIRAIFTPPPNVTRQRRPRQQSSAAQSRRDVTVCIHSLFQPRDQRTLCWSHETICRLMHPKNKKKKTITQKSRAATTRWTRANCHKKCSAAQNNFVLLSNFYGEFHFWF